MHRCSLAFRGWILLPEHQTLVRLSWLALAGVGILGGWPGGVLEAIGLSNLWAWKHWGHDCECVLTSSSHVYQKHEEYLLLMSFFLMHCVSGEASLSVFCLGLHSPWQLFVMGILLTTTKSSIKVWPKLCFPYEVVGIVQRLVLTSALTVTSNSELGVLPFY